MEPWCIKCRKLIKIWGYSTEEEIRISLLYQASKNAYWLPLNNSNRNEIVIHVMIVLDNDVMIVLVNEAIYRDIHKYDVERPVNQIKGKNEKPYSLSAPKPA